MSIASDRVPVRVWDAPVRLVHWSLVGLIAWSWWSGTEGGLTMTWHMRSGYAILTLLLFRLVWGFIGGRHARFRDFLYAPRAVAAYTRTLFSRQAHLYAGHNPVGGVSALLMMLCILVQAVTGLFASDDVLTEGPLYGLIDKATSDWLTTVHFYNFYVLLALVGVHVAAILFYRVWKRENLVGAMITGCKNLPPELAPAGETRGTPLRALAALLASAALVYLIVNAA